jgi:hypothetical protein
MVKILNILKKPFRFIFYRSKHSFIKLTTERYLNLYRPSSYPYLSGDTLRRFSHHVYDETSKNSKLKIKNGDTVFVKIEFLREFLLTVNKKFSNTNYKVISHNDDTEVNSDLIGDIDYSNINLWSQNLNILENRNTFFIPIGLENRRFLKNGRLHSFNKFTKLNLTKKYLVTSNFNSNTNLKYRYPIEKLFNSINYVETKKFKSEIYLEELSKYKFAICPAGNGLDTHRIWESLFVNTIPITIKDNFSQNLVNNNIPCLVLETWEDFLKFTPNDLINIYDEYLDKFDFKVNVSFDYWWNRIQSKAF